MKADLIHYELVKKDIIFIKYLNIFSLINCLEKENC